MNSSDEKFIIGDRLLFLIEESIGKLEEIMDDETREFIKEIQMIAGRPSKKELKEMFSDHIKGLFISWTKHTLRIMGKKEGEEGIVVIAKNKEFVEGVKEESWTDRLGLSIEFKEEFLTLLAEELYKYVGEERKVSWGTLFLDGENLMVRFRLPIFPKLLISEQKINGIITIMSDCCNAPVIKIEKEKGLIQDICSKCKKLSRVYET